jgi:hypothetical protein
MRIEQLTVRLRVRTAWEAVELGMALVRRHAGAVWKPWLWLTLPLFVVLNAGAWLIDQFWLAALLMWWLKPLFDRVPLYVLSRAVFGSVPTTAETLRAQKTWGWKSVRQLLTWRRFSPVRSLYMPIDLLEGVQGDRLRQRRSVLGGQAYGTAVLLTLICLHFEAALVVGGLTAVLVYLPTSLLPDNVQAAFQLLSEAPPAWMKLAWNALLWMATSVVEPFFVGAGFGLYLNRRTQIEAWDVEIVFRKLRTRLAAVTPLLLAVMLLGGSLLAGASAPVHAQERDDVPAKSAHAVRSAQKTTAPPTLPRVFGEQRVDEAAFRRAADKAYQDPLLDRTRTQSTWERRHPEEKEEEDEARDLPPWLRSFGNVFAFLGEWGLWLIVGALVLVLLVTTPYWLPWMRGRRSDRKASSDAVETEALVLPDVLPDDVATVARRLWAEGKPRHALALLYRASVESMSARAGIALVPGATEAECLRASRRQPDEQDRSVFARIVRMWQYAAYAQRLPEAQAFEALVGDLQRRYGWTA